MSSILKCLWSIYKVVCICLSHLSQNNKKKGDWVIVMSVRYEVVLWDMSPLRHERGHGSSRPRVSDDGFTVRHQPKSYTSCQRRQAYPLWILLQLYQITFIALWLEVFIDVIFWSESLKVKVWYWLLYIWKSYLLTINEVLWCHFKRVTIYNVFVSLPFDHSYRL